MDIFSTDREKAIELFQNFSKENNNEEFLKYKDRISLSDEHVIKYLNYLNIKTVSELQGLETKHRNSIIKKSKTMNGVSLRQLARITGLSKSVIDRI